MAERHSPSWQDQLRGCADNLACAPIYCPCKDSRTTEIEGWVKAQVCASTYRVSYIFPYRQLRSTLVCALWFLENLNNEIFNTSQLPNTGILSKTVGKNLDFCIVNNPDLIILHQKATETAQTSNHPLWCKIRSPRNILHNPTKGESVYYRGVREDMAFKSSD